MSEEMENTKEPNGRPFLKVAYVALMIAAAIACFLMIRVGPPEKSAALLVDVPNLRELLGPGMLPPTLDTMLTKSGASKVFITMQRGKGGAWMPAAVLLDGNGSVPMISWPGVKARQGEDGRSVILTPKGVHHRHVWLEYERHVANKRMGQQIVYQSQILDRNELEGVAAWAEKLAAHVNPRLAVLGGQLHTHTGQLMDTLPETLARPMVVEFKDHRNDLRHIHRPHNHDADWESSWSRMVHAMAKPAPIRPRKPRPCPCAEHLGGAFELKPSALAKSVQENLRILRRDKQNLLKQKSTVIADGQWLEAWLNPNLSDAKRIPVTMPSSPRGNTWHPLPLHVETLPAQLVIRAPVQLHRHVLQANTRPGPMNIPGVDRAELVEMGPRHVEVAAPGAARVWLQAHGADGQCLNAVLGFHGEGYAYAEFTGEPERVTVFVANELKTAVEHIVIETETKPNVAHKHRAPAYTTREALESVEIQPMFRYDGRPDGFAVSNLGGAIRRFEGEALGVEWDLHWLGIDRPLFPNNQNYQLSSSTHHRIAPIWEAGLAYPAVTNQIAGVIGSAKLKGQRLVDSFRLDLPVGATTFEHGGFRGELSPPSWQYLRIAEMGTEEETYFRSSTGGFVWRLKPEVRLFDAAGTEQPLAWQGFQKEPFSVEITIIENIFVDRAIRQAYLPEAEQAFETYEAQRKDLIALQRQHPLGYWKHLPKGTINEGYYIDDLAGYHFLRDPQLFGEVVSKEIALSDPKGAKRFGYQAVPFMGYHWTIMPARKNVWYGDMELLKWKDPLPDFLQVTWRDSTFSTEPAPYPPRLLLLPVDPKKPVIFGKHYRVLPPGEAPPDQLFVQTTAWKLLPELPTVPSP